MTRVLITGAAAGLGLALARAALARGARVVGVDRAAMPLTGTPGFEARACDLSDRAAVLALADGVGPLDTVILNAGVSATGRFEAIPARDHRAVLEVNAVAPILLANALGPRLPRGGRLVAIASLSHATGYPGAASYAASKDALAVYARSLRPALRRQGVSVTVVFPGPLRTDHAARHAPRGAREGNRRAPDLAAAEILAGADRRRSAIGLGLGARGAFWLGALAPGLTTRAMRRLLFERMDEPTSP